MRDHRANVEPRLQHARHLVPGLEHLAAVDALHDEALEDHFVPVDAGVLRHDAKQRHVAAVVHRAQHLAKRRRHPGHLEPDVEAFLHLEALHRLIEAGGAHIERARGAHLPRELEPIGVHVGDHDVAAADEAGDRDRHDADGAGACDQHVLADQVEGQRRVGRVAEGIQDRGDLVGDRIGQLEHVAGGQRHVLGEAAGAVDADAERVATQVAASGAAVAAVAAGDVPFARDAIADAESAHFAS